MLRVTLIETFFLCATTVLEACFIQNIIAWDVLYLTSTDGTVLVSTNMVAFATLRHFLASIQSRDLNVISGERIIIYI